MEILSKIFGGRERVKIMRLFLLNPDRVYDLKKIANTAGLSDKDAERDVVEFERAGLLKKKILKDIKNSGKESAQKAQKRVGWILDQSFMYLSHLQGLLLKTAILKSADLVNRLGKAANLKTVVISGIFIQNWDSRVDILVVADRIKKGVLEKVIHSIESELGRELRYTILESADFQYRLSIGDKLVRDIFDFPHQVIVDRSGRKT